MNTLKLTSRERYAVNAMIKLAKAEDNKPTPLADIAKKSDISVSYLEQLISALKKHGLVKSYRGPGGGYLLNKPKENIFISDILEAAEDSLPAKKSGNDNKNWNCDSTQALWGHIGEILQTNLQEITLEDVLIGKIRKSAT